LNQRSINHADVKGVTPFTFGDVPEDGTKSAVLRADSAATLVVMSRQHRGRVHAGVYHVWLRTTGPVRMFVDDFDRTSFCRRLSVSVARYGWICVGFVLMPTHFHLVLEVEDDALPVGMHALFGPYAQEFNRRHARSGHLRAAPYKLRRIDDDRGLRAVVRYVARNPSRARLCREPQDWQWSSYPGSAGYERPFPFVNDELVLGTLHEDMGSARHLLRDVVEPRHVKGVAPITYVV
jgi:REP element-mobilizing transposase RayT